MSITYQEEREELSPWDMQLLRRLDRAIEEQMPDGDLGMETLSRKLGLSRRTLYRHSQRLLGMAPATYVRQKRLTKASRLLQDSRLSRVADVARAVGLSHEHLTRLYKARFGVIPSHHLRK